MKNLLKQISVILISGLLIIASGGFGLIHHYCGCTDNENISILTENSCCPDDMKSIACKIDSETETVSCCQVDTSEKPANSNDCSGEDGCCSSEYLYFKTDKFDLSGNNRINLDFTIAYKTIILDNQSQDLLTEGFTFQINNNLPPPEYGKNLLTSLHQLKIAAPLV